MSHYEIKTGDGRETYADLDAVKAAIRSGKIGRAANIRESGAKEWRRVDSLDELNALFSTDIWSAWEDDSDDSLLDAFQKEEAPKPARLEPAPTVIDEVEELPEASVAPVDPEPVAASESEPDLPGESTDMFERPQRRPITPASTTHPTKRRRPPAKIIEFPLPEPLQMDGVHALDMKRESATASRPPASRLPVRWGPIAVIGVLATAGMLMWVWFVNINADAAFADRRNTSEVTPNIGVPLAEAEVEAVVSPYDTLEDELREQLMEGILDIPEETDFEDALLIELRRVRVDVRSVRVKIESWAGRNNDVPDQVSFNLKVVGREGELDRGLGALGLVLGKYVQHYGLQVSTLNIILSSEEGLRKIQMNPETARRYFTHRVSLERFLSTAFAAQ